jgi:hypothetical protein
MYMGISQNPGTPKNIWLMDVYSLKYGENSFNPLPYTVVTFGKGHLFSIDDHFALLFGMTSTFDGICMDILYLDGDVWVVPYLSNLFGTYVFVSNPQKMDECFQGVDDGFHIFQDSNNSFQINFFGVCFTMYLYIYIYSIFIMACSYLFRERLRKALVAEVSHMLQHMGHTSLVLLERGKKAKLVKVGAP